MKIAEFRAGLRLLAEGIEAWGARGGAGDLQKLNNALAKHDDLTIAEFIRVIDEKPVKAQKKQPDHQNDEELMNGILSELRSKENIEEFSTALAIVASDKKRITNPLLYIIADKYIGVKVKRGNRNAAIKAIKDARVEAARATNKVSHISDVF